MKKKYIISVIILFVVAGCEGEKQTDSQSDGFVTVDVTKKYPNKELILQDFMDVEYIPLETNEEFVTTANTLAISNDVIIFRNSQRAAPDIYVFDRTGKGLRRINRHGQGPEEYNNVQGIALDEDNDEIFVNNTFSKKVIAYDLFGNFKRSFKQDKDYSYYLMYNFDRDNLICHDLSSEFQDTGLKKNHFSIVSKQDGSAKEIQISYKEKKSLYLIETDKNGDVIRENKVWNRALIPCRDSWILTESSSDTIFNYSSNHDITPIIVRTPSVQSMNPEVFLFPGVLTDRYYFMQTVKKIPDPEAENEFPRTDLLYDKQENAIFECVVYNDDFTNKKPMSLVYEVPMFAFGSNDIAIVKRLEAHEIVEAYERGELKGKLKDIVAKLDEDDNPVMMLVKHKK